MVSVLMLSVIDHGFKTWSCGVMLSVLPSSVQDLVVWCNGTWSYGVMLSVLPSSVIDHWFKTWSCGVMVSVLPSSVRSWVQYLVVWCNI